jgi:hypothetical protein
MNRGNAIPKHACPEAKVAILPLDRNCSGLVAHSGEILITGKSPKKDPDRLFPKDNLEMTKVLRFKYATWNVRGLGEKEEALDKTLNENHIKISVIIERRNKLWGTKGTENYMVVYGAVNRYTVARQGLTWINKSISNKTDLDPVRTVIDNIITEQVNSFNYLGNLIS